MRQGRYGGYRGRATVTDYLRRIAIVLFILVVLVCGGLFLGQEYIVYTDQGLRLELPFFQREEPKQEEEDLGEVEVIVEPETPEEPQKPAPEQNAEPLRAITLSMESVQNGSALEQAKQAGANAIVLEMKNQWGRLGYYSDLSAAQTAGSNLYGQEINQTLRELGAEITLVAQISCFKDHQLADSLEYAIVTNPGRRWFDASGVRWSSPGKEGVRAYLCGIAQELSELGFQEIVLTDWGYPTTGDGHLEYIKKGAEYDPERVGEVIDAFLAEMSLALEGSGTKLSLSCDAQMLSGTERESGRRVEQVDGLSGTLWTEDAAAAGTMLSAAGVSNWEEKLTLLGKAFAQEEQRNQVVVP